MTPIMADTAERYRILAEMSRDPELFRRAAAEYGKAGDEAQAVYCYRMAQWYEVGR